MKPSTITAYEKYHEIYDEETTSFWENFPESTLQAFINKLPGKTILNLGSGPGRDAVLLKNKGLEVICIDAAAEMIKRTRSLGFPSIKADFRRLPIADRLFDGIWAYTSLLHLSQQEMLEVLSKLYWVLRPKGVFLIGMIEGDFEGEIEKENMPGAPRYFKYYQSNQLKKLMTHEGFDFNFEERYIPGTKTYLSQIYLKK